MIPKSKSSATTSEGNPMFECELCGGMLVFLGQLGMREHFRCRDCGMMYSVDVSAELADA